MEYAGLRKDSVLLETKILLAFSYIKLTTPHDQPFDNI